jgi:hypothetical protein
MHRSLRDRYSWSSFPLPRLLSRTAPARAVSQRRDTEVDKVMPTKPPAARVAHDQAIDYFEVPNDNQDIL